MEKVVSLGLILFIVLGFSPAYSISQINIEESAGQTEPPLSITDSGNNVLLRILSDGTAIINQFIQISDSGLTKLRNYVFPDSSGTVVLHNATQTISNKVLDADSNSITNIDNDEIKSNAAIDVTKLSTGIVGNTEFDRLDGVTSDIQTQLDSKVNDGTNVGAGTGFVFKDKSGNDLRFKTIKAGNKISITDNVDDITIDALSVGIPTLVRLGSDFSTTSTICCVDATGLSFSVSSGTVYHFKFLVRWDTTSPNNRGIGLTLNGPPTTFLTYDVIYPIGQTSGIIHSSNIYNLDITSGSSPNFTNLAIIEGLIQPSSDGTLIVRFQADNGNTVTIRANSVGFLTVIP